MVEIEGLRIGMHSDRENSTGCTVLLPPQGSLAGVAVRGGAPGTREVAALGPYGSIEACHAIALCGSSLFGLRAADGVVDWCAQREIGLPLAGRFFPIVGAAVVFDLRDPDQRAIDLSAGYDACESARPGWPEIGAVGAGTGCTVGKEAGPQFAAPGGQGWACESFGDVVVGAVMVVNAFGSVIGTDGEVLVGPGAAPDVARYPFTDASVRSWPRGANTVIGCIVTNAILSKPQACRVADLAHNGIARAVRPAHTSFDGDTLFAIATREVETNLDLVCELACIAVERAIRIGVDPAQDSPV